MVAHHELVDFEERLQAAFLVTPPKDNVAKQVAKFIDIIQITILLLPY
jgi:hypothetical protein